MRVKVLLDTDIGSDIDDAVCLAYLLAQPRCELMGITTVSGEAERRARLASVLCRVAGRTVPILPGEEHPQRGAQRQPQAQQAEALARWPHDTGFPRGEAIGFLRDTIRRHPGEVVLLPIGPLTNVARLFREAPDTPGLLKALVLMGGRFTTAIPGAPHAEWNIRCDPEAATAVYAAPVRVHRSVGLDVTLRVRMAADAVRQRFEAPLLRPVLDFAEVWFRREPMVTFHDPLAAAAIFREDLCRFVRGQVTVDAAGGADDGVTRWQAVERGPHEVALDVDADAFFREFFSMFPPAAT